MSQAGHDYEAQRELERHALRNVNWLAAKLGYRDALDKRKERRLLIGMGGGVVVILAGLCVNALLKDGAARVKVADELHKQVMTEYRAVSQADRDAIYEDKVRAAVHALCPVAQ